MISLVLASRLLFGSLPHGLQENPDADLTNQLFNNAETSYCNLIDNSTSIFHKELFNQSAVFLPSEDIEDFFNNNFQNTSNNFNYPTEYQPPVKETFENYDFGFQSDTNNSNNDNSTLQNNIQFDPSFDFDLNLLLLLRHLGFKMMPPPSQATLNLKASSQSHHQRLSKLVELFLQLQFELLLTLQAILLVLQLSFQK